MHNDGDLYDKANEKLDNLETRINQKNEIFGIELGHKHTQEELMRMKETADKAAKEADNNYEITKIFGINFKSDEQQEKHKQYHKRSADVGEKILSREDNMFDGIGKNILPIVQKFIPPGQ